MSQIHQHWSVYYVASHFQSLGDNNMRYISFTTYIFPSDRSPVIMLILTAQWLNEDSKICTRERERERNWVATRWSIFKFIVYIFLFQKLTALISLLCFIHSSIHPSSIYFYSVKYVSNSSMNNTKLHILEHWEFI